MSIVEAILVLLVAICFLIFLFWMIIKPRKAGVRIFLTLNDVDIIDDALEEYSKSLLDAEDQLTEEGVMAYQGDNDLLVKIRSTSERINGLRAVLMDD